MKLLEEGKVEKGISVIRDIVKEVDLEPKKKRQKDIMLERMVLLLQITQKCIPAAFL